MYYHTFNLGMKLIPSTKLGLEPIYARLLCIQHNISRKIKKKKKYLDVKMSPQSVRPLLRKFAIKLANPNNSYKVEFKFCVGCHYHNDIYK